MHSFQLRTESWPFSKPLTITGYTLSQIRTLYVEICDGEHVGRGEAGGVYYTGETVDTMHAQAESIRYELESGATRSDLLLLLPSGGARNAIDAALWDLEAKRAGKSIWDLVGLPLNETITVATVGIDAPDAMAEAAARLSSPRIKIKVNGEDPLDQIAAVRRARPEVDLVIDVNQGWTYRQLVDLAPRVQELGVSMVEQPLPRGADAELAEYQSPVPLCADESCLDLSELEQAAHRYEMINIKLDKVGGLTAGLELAHRAKALGLGVMVGNMAGTSLAMAPGLVLAQLCDLVDLDGPLILATDRENPLHFEQGKVSGLTPDLWG
ncbi:MAG: dipeptide epimerase [Pseudomonadota bacterium]